MRTATRVMRGVTALAALAAITIGMPAFMLLVSDADPRRVLPDEWPPLEQLPEWAWYRLRDAWNTGDLVFWAFALTGWLAWLALMWGIVLEAFYQIRYGAAVARDHLSAIDPRRWVTGLVSSAVLLGAPSPAASAAGGPGEQVVATAPRHPPDTDLGTHRSGATLPTAAPDEQPAEPEPTSYTARCPRIHVVHGDTLWGLAERHLGDGRRYHEIIGLNLERLYPDGPNHLDIGWELLLPPDATNLPEAAATRPCRTDTTVTVAPRDTLSAIAARELGNPDQWPAIFAANHRRPQPDGRALVDPDLILPGWTLVIPGGTSAGVDRAPPDPADEPAGDARTRGRDSPPTTGVDPSPGQGEEEWASPERTRVPLAEPDPHPGTGISLPTGTYVGLTLAALVTVAATTVWLWRRRTHVPGRRRRDDLDTPPVVRAMRVALDIATLPRDDDGDLVYEPLPGDRPGEIGAQDRALATALTIQPADGETIVGIVNGRPVAVDLARTKGLGLTGPGADAAARALAVDLLADTQNPDRRAPLLLMPHADANGLLDTADLRHPPRSLHTASTLDAALDWLEAELLTRTRHQATSGGSPHEPLVLIAARATPEHARRLRGILDSGADAGIAAILLGEWASGTTIEIAADGTVRTARGDQESDLANARLFSLPTDDARQLLDILGTADAAHDPATSAADIDLERATTDPDEPAPELGAPLTQPPVPTPTVDVPPPNETPSSPAAADAMAHHQYVDEQDTVDDPASVPLRLSLLGRVRLSFRGPAGVADIALEPKQRTLLTCLALHREGQRRDAVIATIWADARADRYPNRLHAQLNLIRKALRKHTDGAVQEMVCHDGAYYGLDPAVVSVDLWDLQNTLRTAPTSAQVTSLYRGPLAADLAAPWIEAHRQHLHQDVVAALHQQARAAEDDPERQLEILDELRRLDPHNEDTYRAIARTQARLERHEAIGDTLARLTTSLAEIGERPSRDIIDYCKSLRERRTV